MGWAYCGTNRHGQEIGYGVRAICDEPGCSDMIDRGLGNLCGDMHNDGETCAMYYCGQHLTAERRCLRCVEEIDSVRAEKDGEKNKASKQALREEIRKLRFVGQKMANVCLGCAHDKARFTEHERKNIGTLWRNWDAIERAERDGE